jgi:hypothetical protein
MPLRRAASLVLVLAAACHPSVRGRCSSDTDCRAGSSCSPDGLCVNLPRPSVQVIVAEGSILAPSAPRVMVHVTASPQLTLSALSVAVTTGRTVASGTLAVAAQGDNNLTLTHFEPDAVGQVNVTATLTFSAPGGAADSVSSDPGVAVIDSQAPAINVFIPVTSDMVNGWVPRTGGTLEVQAQVDDGAGSGPASATLTLDHCPSAVPCSYAGTLLAPPSAGAATFSFAVPRAVQAAGSEAKVTGVIVAQDEVQNSTRKAVSLQIDDAPPSIAPVALVSAGVAGEDGHSWFPGGASASPVEIAVAATDHGAGLLDVVLHLDPADVTAGTADPAPVLNADGAFHFRLPASAVIGREGPLRFSLTARDALHNTAALPESPATSVFIDDVPPVVTMASVNYASTMPPQADVCSTDANVLCGRTSTGGAADHLLRDDIATVTFDAYDCGAGLPMSGGAGVNGVNATPASSSGAPCTGSANPVHHFSVQLDLSTQTPGAPDANGSEKLPLDSDALDLLAHRTDNRSGVANISIVRWRSQLVLGVAPTGSPALLPGGSPRQVVIGTNGTPNLFILDPQGAQVQAATVGRISSDVAVDKAGVVYAVGIDSASSASTLSMFDSANPPPSPISPCPIADATIGVPPALAGFPDSPLAVLAATNTSGLHNVYVFRKGNCTPVDSELLTIDAQTAFTGASADADALFFAHSAGFSSIHFDPAGMNFVQSSAASYNVSSGQTAGARGGPAIGVSPENPYFAGTDRKVHKTQAAVCTGQQPCWQNQVLSAATAATLNGTPVFDSQATYVADSNGAVYAFAQSTGLLLGTSAPTTGTTAIAVSSPVLVGTGQALVVQRDATVRLLTPGTSTAVTLLQMKTPAGAAAAYAATGPPPTPVVDARGTGGVAYVPDGNGFVWAVQLDQAPVAASATT